MRSLLAILLLSALVALTGGAVLVPTPLGTSTVEIAPRKHDGQELSLAEEGLARPGGTQRGALHLRFLVQPLAEVSPGVRALLEQIDGRLREEDPSGTVALWDRKVQVYLRQRAIVRDRSSAP